MHDQMPGNSTALNPQWKTQSFVRWVTNTFRFLLPSIIFSCELWGQLLGTQVSVDGVDLKSGLNEGQVTNDSVHAWCTSLQIIKAMIVNQC